MLLHMPPSFNLFRRPMRATEGEGKLILQQDVNLLVQRQRVVPPPSLEIVLRTMPEFSTKVVAERAELLAAAATLAMPLPGAELRAALQQQILGVAEEFCDTLGYDRVLASLECVKDTRCMRFHMDHVDVRLLCTLCGAGTQWADEDAIDRVALARLPPGDGAGMSAIRRNEGLHQASAGDVLWLKGTTFPGAKGQGVVHRSPDAVDDQRPRLLLKLDPPPPPQCCSDPACREQ